MPADRSLHPATSSRRQLLRMGAAAGLAAGAGPLLTACGSSDIVSALQPARFISFGDGMSDLGQAGNRYTVNDSTINTWVDRLANHYGKTITAQSQGGLGFAQGHGATEALPRSIAAQIDAFLATQKFATNDVVLVNLPMYEVLQQAAAVKAGTLAEDVALARVDAAGKALAAEVKRLIAAGATRIVTCGVYDLGKSPFAIAQSQVSFMSAASLKLNDAFKVDAVGLGSNLLYIDTAYYVNRNVEFGYRYGFSNSTGALCTTATALTCTDSTLVVASSSKATYLFADGIHLTPSGNQQLGDYAHEQLAARW